MRRHTIATMLVLAVVQPLAATSARAQSAQGASPALVSRAPVAGSRDEVPSHTTLRLTRASLTIEPHANGLQFEARNTVDRVQTVFEASQVSAWAQASAALLDHDRASVFGANVLGDIGSGRRTEYRSTPLTSADSTSLVLGRIESATGVEFDLYVSSADSRHTVYTRLSSGAAEQLLSALSRAAGRAAAVARQ